MDPFEGVRPSLPGGGVLVLALVGAFALVGILPLTVHAVAVAMDGGGYYGRRPAWVWPGGGALLLLVVTIVCWVLAGATADPQNGLAMLFLHVGRPFFYVAGFAAGGYITWQTYVR